MPLGSAPPRSHEPVFPRPKPAMLRRQWRRLGRHIATGRYPLHASALSAAIIERDRIEQPPRNATQPVPAALECLLIGVIVQLPPLHALVLQLALVEQLSDPAIGEVAGWPVVRVARLRRTALRLLSQRLRRSIVR